MNNIEHLEKIQKFLDKDGGQAFRTKTPYEELPLEMKYGSSTHHPDKKGGQTTADSVLWIKFLNEPWFRPYGNFDKFQIEKLIELCHNDNQIVSLMELLSATK